MDKLAAFKAYLIDYKDQKESTLAMNILIMENIVEAIGEFTHDNIEGYILSLKQQDRQASTIKAHISLIHFWGECFGVNDAKTYKFKGKLKQKPYDRAVFSDEESKAFLSLPNPFKEGCKYWKRYEMWGVFWTICTYQACRPGEAVRLRTFPIKGNKSHADFGLNTITFDQKTGLRKMPMARIVRERLLAYIPTIEGEYLFPPLHKSKTPYMLCESWENDFTNRLERLEEQFPGITKRENLDPYSVRATGATRWVKQKKNLKVIQDLMGHKKITTTEKYIKLDLDHLQEEIDDDRLSDEYISSTEALARVEEESQALKKRFTTQLEVVFNISSDKLVVEYKVRK